ncbi:hypothetical protein ACHAWF_001246 [Thalassiosira exigua]
MKLPRRRRRDRVDRGAAPCSRGREVSVVRLIRGFVMSSQDDGPERPSRADVVRIRYADLASATPSGANDLVERAFGSNAASLGIVAITDVPNLASLRLRLLPLARELATSSPDELDGVTVPEAEYQVGWSHGREKLEGDKSDFGKGSFYANPLTEDLTEALLERRRYQRSRQEPDGERAVDADMEELLEWDESFESIGTDDELRSLAKSNPGVFAPNVWPSHMPQLQSAFNDVARLVHEVGLLVARCADSYVSSQCKGYEPRKLERILRNSKCCKARLLHYFPMKDVDGNDGPEDNGDDTQFSNWCGWHNDHGSLTGLLPALYLDDDGRIVDCPDPEAGLYIKSRNGALVHAKIPNDAIAFQVGETMQIHSGGVLQATPHAVRGCARGNVSRETFAVFMEPEYHSGMNLPDGRTLSDAQHIEAEKYLPKNVRALSSRWKPGMNFGEFSEATFAAFH